MLPKIQAWGRQREEEDTRTKEEKKDLKGPFLPPSPWHCLLPLSASTPVPGLPAGMSNG